MVSVIGKEMVPYDASLHRDHSSQSSSSSIVIGSGPPAEEENSTAVGRLSDFINSSDSDLSSQETVVNRSRKLDLLAAPEDIDEVDSECIEEILEDHKNYPPQHRLGDSEENPATREKLNYFLKVLKLKITKYSKLANCRIPESLQNIPIALSYEAFITLYWPGAMSCCKKLYKSSHKYSAHYYKQHVPQIKIPSPSLNLGSISATPPKDGMTEKETGSKTSSVATVDGDSDNSSDIISLPEELGEKCQPPQQTVPNFRQAIASQSLTNQPSSSSNTSSLVPRKRKTLSPSSRPGPLSYKQPRLNHTIATVDSSVESEDEKSSSRPKRGRKRCDSHDAPKKETEKHMDQLEIDQMIYEPQHRPGAPEDFIASAERLKYFADALALKFSKYVHLNTPRQAHSSTHLPLALSLAGFIQYYWPGKAKCCGLVRENSLVLEKHISRSHRPPKPGPSLAVIPQTDSSVARDTGTDAANVRQTKIRAKSETLDKSSSKSPAGFQADQHKFPPQHKPGEPEDFCANQESIDYFLEVLAIKREKYASIVPIKEKPLSSGWADFVLHYWPGMMDCCGHILNSCKEFQVHFSNSHLPPKKIPHPKVVDPSAAFPGPAQKTETVPNLPVSRSVPSVAFSPAAQSPSRSQRSSNQLAIEAAPCYDSASQSTSLLSTPSHLLMINSIHEEARKLRSQAALVMTVSALLPLLDRLLELSSSITNRIRGAMEVEALSQAIECLEYVWNASKVAIVRWEDLKGRSNRDTYLSAIQYAYGTLPVFTNWEQSKHLEMLENIILLSLNTVKNWQPPPSSPEGKMINRQSSIRRLRLTKPTRTMDVSTIQEPSQERMGQFLATSLDASVSVPVMDKDSPKREEKEKTSNAVLDFCRLANISTWHNTKARSVNGYRDDHGHYHAMYRYGIGKAISLYCPPGITHLRCCGKSFDLARLKTHVMQCHEANGQSNRTEPSISPV